MCTLAQALRLCTGRTAHRWIKGIALPFLDHGIRSGWGVSLTPRPLFTPGKDPVRIVQEAGWAPGPFWTGAENLASSGIFFVQWSITGQDIVSTFASLYCQGNCLLVLCLDTSLQRPWSLMLPVYLLGPLRCMCVCFFFGGGTVPFAVVLLCSCQSPSCPGCIHLVVATFGSFFCSSTGFQPWSISRMLR